MDIAQNVNFFAKDNFFYLLTFKSRRHTLGNSKSNFSKNAYFAFCCKDDKQ